MIFREAKLADIDQLTLVRGAVRENVLRTPGLVTHAAYVEYLTQRGKGWVAATTDGTVTGFAIADLRGHSVWALFVHPDYAGQGLGKELHRLMLTWYFARTTEPLWLSTAPGTRAEEFYRRQGWQVTGHTASGEVRFEITAEQWLGDELIRARAVRDDAFLLLNRVAQDQLPLSAGLAWFDALSTEAQQTVMGELHLFVQQSRPTPEIVRQATESAPIRPGATPLALLRTFPFLVALRKVLHLRADERRNAFAALLTVFRLADTERRATQCRGCCGHEWHNLPPMP